MNESVNWKNCLIYIRDRLPEQAFQTWFDGIKVTNVTEQEITLQVPNQFHYEWIESKYRNLLNDAINKFYNKSLIVNYSIIVSNKNTSAIPKFDHQDKPLPQNFRKKSQLNSRYTFYNFIEGKSNQFAKATALSVSKSPGKTPYNPLLIYSSPGLGKTHLIQAVGNYAISTNPNYRILYITSERFMLDFITSIQRNKSSDFIKNYRNIDMLLIDDIHFFQKKEQTQEQFFHLFNDLLQKGKQIVLTCDKHPNELIDIKDRLISRFQSGLIVDIQSPDLETRIAILMKKADDENLEIPYEVTEFLAANITTDIRTMEGALVKLLAIASLGKKDISISLARDVLKDILDENAMSNITIDQIINIICQFQGLKEKDIISKKRTKDIAVSRQIIMYFSRKLTNLSLSVIGSKIGGRDHSTVIHSFNLINSKREKDINFNKFLDKIEKKLI
tara:strand:- start:261 stop:1598 length:1338 start_codon:yes stop_codon:yes gene_type:complete